MVNLFLAKQNGQQVVNLISSEANGQYISSQTSNLVFLAKQMVSIFLAKQVFNIFFQDKQVVNAFQA